MKTIIRFSTLSGLFFLMASVVHAKTSARPISDFIAAQQTNFHQKNFGNSLNQVFRIDYSGNDYLTLKAQGVKNLVQPSFYGVIRETTLDDGTGHVEDVIYLVIQNAMTFVVDASSGCGPFVICPAVFGYNFTDISNGSKPVVTDGIFILDLVNTSLNAQLPVLGLADLSFFSGPAPAGQPFHPYLKAWTLLTAATGPLRSPYFPEGAFGLATVKVDEQFPAALTTSNENVSLKMLGGNNKQ